VSAGAPDEQFEWFWLATEVLAEHTKDSAPVHDQCPRCKGPLFCPECKETPTHKPFAIQAIRELIRQHAERDPERLFQVSSEFRRALAHGRRLKVVEEDQGVAITEVVDGLAHVARQGLVLLLIPLRFTAPERTICVVTWDTVLHRRLRVKAICGFESPPEREPQFEDIPGLTVSLVRTPIEEVEGTVVKSTDEPKD